MAFLILFFESHFSFYGIREQTMGQQTLIFLCEQLHTKLLFDESPILIDSLILRCHLWIGHFLRFIVGQELLERAHVKASRLLIDERSLEKHWVGALRKNVLQFLVGNGQSQLLGFIFHQFRLYITVPHSVFHLIHLFVVQVFLSLLHF